MAEFRRPKGPTFLVATECGGEGRNFEFCRRLVLFDLPLDPAQVEQRIGRLDRISRKERVEIVYFRPPSGFYRDLVELYERIGLFREPLGGLERSLANVEAAIRKAEKASARGLAELPVTELVAEVRGAAQVRQRAAYHHLHSEGFRTDLAAGILSRVPAGLDAAMERFVVAACELFGFDVTEKKGVRTWYFEFGGDALLEHLPGVPGGTRFLGTFDREEAVLREELDFFASGHPLVEGIFQELEDGPRGRAALLKLEKSGVDGEGVLFLHRRDGAFAASAIDLAGQPQARVGRDPHAGPREPAGPPDRRLVSRDPARARLGRDGESSGDPGREERPDPRRGGVPAAPVGSGARGAGPGRDVRAVTAKRREPRQDDSRVQARAARRAPASGGVAADLDRRSPRPSVWDLARPRHPR